MNRNVQVLLCALMAILIFTVMALGITDVPAWKTAGSDVTIAQANDVDTVVNTLFDQLVLPFEILGILLTAVMFGALVIARPITVTGNEESSLVHPNTQMPADPPGLAQIPSQAAQIRLESVESVSTEVNE